MFIYQLTCVIKYTIISEQDILNDKYSVYLYYLYFIIHTIQYYIILLNCQLYNSIVYITIS